jgi:hypothetical protein
MLNEGARTIFNVRWYSSSGVSGAMIEQCAIGQSTAENVNYCGGLKIKQSYSDVECVPFQFPIFITHRSPIGRAGHSGR